MTQEVPIGFSCGGDWLYGMLHLPEKPAAIAKENPPEGGLSGCPVNSV